MDRSEQKSASTAAQNNVENRPSSENGAKKRRIDRCGLCGEEGHRQTNRSCPKKANSSEIPLITSIPSSHTQNESYTQTPHNPSLLRHLDLDAESPAQRNDPDDEATASDIDSDADDETIARNPAVVDTDQCDIGILMQESRGSPNDRSSSSPQTPSISSAETLMPWLTHVLR
jgi:hypothetical protein